MNIKKRLQEIGREDYQGFLAEINDVWAYQMQKINGTLSTMLFDCTIADLQNDFENYIPNIKNNVAYFRCEKRTGLNEWKDAEIGIPSKIWWRFLYKPKTTFVTWRMIQ
jgi:hypothetical protein